MRLVAAEHLASNADRRVRFSSYAIQHCFFAVGGSAILRGRPGALRGKRRRTGAHVPVNAPCRERKMGIPKAEFWRLDGLQCLNSMMLECHLQPPKRITCHLLTRFHCPVGTKLTSFGSAIASILIVSARKTLYVASDLFLLTFGRKHAP